MTLTCNCLLLVRLSSKRPPEIFYDQNLFVKMLIALIFLLGIIYQRKKSQKLDTNTKKDIFLGYLEVTKGYEIFLLQEKKVILNWNVIFLNNKDEFLNDPLISQEKIGKDMNDRNNLNILNFQHSNELEMSQI